MKPLPSLFPRFAVLALAVAAIAPMAQAQQPAPRKPAVAQPGPARADALTEQLRELLRQGKAVQALPLARQAAEQFPADYRPPYYLAFALMELGEYASAAEAQQRSLGLASTAPAREAVGALGARLAGARAGAEADAALAEGLNAKAARLYLEAFRHGLLTPQRKLVAATLFIDKLSQVEAGQQLLRSIVTQDLGTPEAEQATLRLQGLKPQLLLAAQRQLAAAQAAAPGSAARTESLARALALDDDSRAAHVLTLGEDALGDDWPRLEARMKLLHRRGWLEGSLLSRRLDLRRWQAHPGLRELLADIWGEARATELLRRAAMPPLPQSATLPQMVMVSKGNFVMGSARGRPDEMPLRSVDIAQDFEIGRTEVTVEQWDACVADGGCGGYRPDDQGWGRGERPVIMVSWHDAQAYLNWLNRITGLAYRLPTEAEWEYAARAGSRTEFPWGDTASHEHANMGAASCCSGASAGADRWENTAPVGQFPPNAFGLYDMHGNVWEWVQDCRSSNYVGAPSDGREWQHGQCANRTDRGGGWSASPDTMRSAYRGTYGADRRGNHVGFRVARSL